MNDTSPNREPQSAHSQSDSTLLVPVAEDGPDREVILTPPQERALECLLDGCSVSRAAKLAGVSRQTLHRWISDSADFQTVYNAWHREIQKSVKDRLTALGDAAMDNLATAIRFKGNMRASEFVVKHLLAQKEK